MAETVQPHPASSGHEYATTCPRNSTRSWPIIMGLYNLKMKLQGSEGSNLKTLQTHIHVYPQKKALL